MRAAWTGSTRVFVNAEDLKNTIGLHGNGGGSTRLRMSLHARMATEPVPGEYLCQ